MSLFLAFDTSNYTTSVALYNSEFNQVYQKKKLLPVKKGEKGIRQSDAVFHHTQQVPVLVQELMQEVAEKTHTNRESIASQIAAIGVSSQPRRVEGSYMPCFTVGMNVASSVASILQVPLFTFSHQEGHVAAALYSSDRLDLMGQEFLAFHVSGGTTESLKIHRGTQCPLEAELIGTSSDLKAGQAIDRVGVMLGLDFPAGPALELLALKSSKTYKMKPSMKGLNCSLSGVENKCKQMLQQGEAPEDIALFCITYVQVSLAAMAEKLSLEAQGEHIVFSGGVMSNSIIRNAFLQQFDCSFAEPIYSSDNAAGIAVLTAYQYH